MTNRQPSLLFAGFLLKKVVNCPDWLKAPKTSHLEDICSVSNCFSSPPKNWIEQWKHNQIGFYNTEELALSTLPVNELNDFTLFAYLILPWKFDKHGQSEFDVATEFPELPIFISLQSYRSLGYDVVGHTTNYGFDCSPLSCNSMAQEIEVNRHCLLPDLNSAIAAGMKFGNPSTGVEPGVYFIVEVLQKI